MSRFRDIKRRARRDLHKEAQVPALYIASTGDDPIPVTVRVWTKWTDSGVLPGGPLPYAERHDITPRILFMLDEIAAPKRNAVVSVEAGEAYRVDNVLEPDDISITAEVIRLSASEAAGLPVPDEV